MQILVYTESVEDSRTFKRKLYPYIYIALDALPTSIYVRNPEDPFSNDCVTLQLTKEILDVLDIMPTPQARYQYLLIEAFKQK